MARHARCGAPAPLFFILPALIAVFFWIGPRALWGQQWRAATQAGGAPAPATCAAAERGSRAWAAFFSDASIDIYTAFFWARAGEVTHARFAALPPVFSGARAATLGDGGADGHKTFAELRYLRAPCVAYSFGGNAEVGFEEALLRAAPCDVWQFDCTVSTARMDAALAHLPASLRARFHFLPYCVGVEGAVVDLAYGGVTARATMRSVRAVMRELGHTRVDVLKMDVEGAEIAALPAFFAGLPPSSRPSQVSMELHAFGDAPPSVKLAPVLALLRAGYVLIAQRDNEFGWRGCCTELAFALCEVVSEV